MALIIIYILYLYILLCMCGAVPLKMIWYAIDKIFNTRIHPQLIDWLARWFDCVCIVFKLLICSMMCYVFAMRVNSHYSARSRSFHIINRLRLDDVQVSANGIFGWTAHTHTHTLPHTHIHTELIDIAVAYYIWQSQISNQMAHQYQLFQVNWLANRELRRRQSINRI